MKPILSTLKAVHIFVCAAIAGGVLCALPSFSRAAPITTEDFESYISGASLNGLAGPSGWSGAWTASSIGVASTITTASLFYANGEIEVSGGNQALKVTNSDSTIEVMASRQLPAQSGNTLYMSMLFRPLSPNGDDDFLQIGFLNAADNPTGSVIDTGGAFMARAGTVAGTTTGVSSNLNTTYFLVLKLQNTTGGAAFDKVSVFVNPSFLNEASNASASATSTDVLSLSGAAYLNIRRAFHETGDAYILDEFRIGTEFGDVVSSAAVPEPSSIVMLGLLVGGGGFASWRRKRKAGPQVP